jgi:hypothetical protein
VATSTVASPFVPGPPSSPDGVEDPPAQEARHIAMTAIVKTRRSALFIPATIVKYMREGGE